MANEVNLTIRVGDNGSLNIVAREAEKAAKATDKLAASSDRAANSRNNYSKGEKGVAGATANSTKAFSKMRQSISGGGGLVAAYATLAANAFALTAAFGVLQRAAAFEQLAAGLTLIGAQSGKNLPGVAQNLKEITGAAVSTEEALRATAVATTSGFSTEQLTRLTKVAKGASQALGRNLPDALDRLVRGTAKLEPEILDELGIIVRLDEATRKYAAALQKPVSELTTFERQQAFLNATIEQGEKKYGALADRLDTNVYDKLAASFNDLTKTVIRFVDGAIEPLVRFLSQNQFALFSAMVLFVSSISRTIVPSIQSVAAANKSMADYSMAQSKKAGKVISTEYTTQLNKVVATAKTMPPSFAAILPSIKNNTVSVKELQAAVLNLKRSEELRTVANQAAGAKVSAQKKQELAEVTALRLETEKLLAAESRRMAANAAGQRARGVGTGAGLTARGLTEMDRATGTFQKFGVAARYSGLQLANVGKTFTRTSKTIGTGTAVLNASRVAFTALAGSVRLFGAAILNAIPVIGQILFALSLVGPYIVNLFGPSQSEKNIQKVTKTFESFNEVAKELARSLATARSEGEALFAKYKAASGTIGQLTGAFSQLKDIQLEQAGEEVNDNIETIINKTKKLAEVRARLSDQQAARDAALEAGDTRAAQRIATNIQRTQQRANALQGTIESLTQDNQAILDKSQVVEAGDALLILQQSLARLQSSGLSAQLPDEEEFIRQLISGLTATGDEAITAEEALRRLGEREKDLNETTAIFDGLPEKVNLFSQAVTKLSEKGKTEFADITGSVKTLENELVALSEKKGGGTLVEEFLGTDDGKLVKGFVANASKAFGDLEGVVKKKVAGSLEEVIDETATDYPAAIAKAREKLEENNQKILESAANAKNLTNQAKHLAEAAQHNAAIVAIQVDLENQAKQAKIEGLEATRQNLIASQGEEDSKERVAQLNAEIKALQADIQDSSEKTFRETNARIKADQRLLGLARKQTQAAKELFNAKQKIKKSDLDVLRAGTNSSSTAQDEAKLLKDQQVRAKELEDEALANKKQAINLEFDLLDAQLTLEKAKLFRLHAEKRIGDDAFKEANAAITKAQTASGATRTALLGSADEQTKANKALIDNNVKIADAKALEEQRLQVLKGQTQEAERFGSFGLEHLENETRRNIFVTEEQRLKNDILQLEKQIEDGKSSQAALTEKELELQKLITDEMIRQQGVRDKAADRIQNASASFAASLRNTTANQQAGANLTAAEATGDEDKIAAAKTESMRQGALHISEVTAGIAEDFRKLGPEGELMAATMEAVSGITETFVGAFDIIGDATSTTAEKMQAGLAIMGSLLSGFASTSKAASDARIRGIDQEIEAEKKRDGKSAQSVAKIKALEAKKDKEARKAFETQKKMKMGSAVIATATGAISAYTGMVEAIPGPVGVAMGAAAAALITAMGMKQLSIIASTSYQGGGSASGSGTPSSVSVGQRSNSIDMARSRGGAGELAYMRGAQGVGGPENFTPAFAGYRNRAEGGNTAFMVGEQGPELFVPNRPGTIVPNDDVQPATPINANINISAVDAAGVEDVLMNQRGNIISMIREAANAQGNTFLEDINVAEL